MSKIIETPLMKQYMEMKRQHPDAVLLFRVGDFYETFADDAVTASQILGITLTRRANGAASSVELAGFPHHALDTYLPKLVRAGKRVAICEQLEDPRLTRKLVKRGITELVTPGLNLSDSLLESNRNNFLGGVYFGSRVTGAAFLDISTGEFMCTQGDNATIHKLLSGIEPSEVVVMRGDKNKLTERFALHCSVFELEDWIYTSDAANERLTRQFGTTSLRGFGLDHMEEAVIAAGSLMYYLDNTQHTHTRHITSLARIDEERYVRLDPFTIRNLELLHPMTPEGKCLLDVMDRTQSPPGARMMRRRIGFPLTRPAEINARLDAVEALVADDAMRDDLIRILAETGDPERIASKVATLRVTPREMVRLRQSLEAFTRLRNRLAESSAEALRHMATGIGTLPELIERLRTTLREDAPALAAQGNYIAAGVDAELDELRDLLSHGKEALEAMRVREVEATGIPSLKIGFNSVFGYYIEVRNTHRDRAPQSWIRKQTLVGAERYITPELKEYEQKILGAQERISILETKIFNTLIEETSKYIPAIRRNAAEAAEADCCLSAALCAIDYGYVRPTVDDSLILDITDGRHPVIERTMPVGERYVANSLRLDPDTRQIMMITGPNMSGKSALLRSTALITLMAQTGAFVPARAATIGTVDKIFTRVGASDNISAGESTFMVEMTEAASILHNLTPRSLVLFDELGRGTSTYDGISLAWAIVEYLHENGVAQPKTLFATHYHELNEMADTFKRIANYNIAVHELDGHIVFLRKLQPGGSEHSFGIHVARLAGIPASIVERAGQVLRRLESDGAGCKGEMKDLGTRREGHQWTLFQLDDPLLSQIRDQILNLDIDNLTPLQALTQLHTLKSLLLGR